LFKISALDKQCFDTFPLTGVRVEDFRDFDLERCVSQMSLCTLRSYRAIERYGFTRFLFITLSKKTFANFPLTTQLHTISI